MGISDKNHTDNNGISKYEAAALYDYKTIQTPGLSTYLVLDLDDSSCGVCQCDIQGNPRLLYQWDPMNVDLWQLCVESVESRVGDLYNGHKTGEEMDSQLSLANEAIRNYTISDRMMDSKAFTCAGTDISCTQLEEYLQPVKERIQGLLRLVQENVNERVLMNTGIILLGHARQLELISYYIREQLCADPLVEDGRFRNGLYQVEDAQIVEAGRKLYSEKSVLEHSYALLLFDRETEKMEPVHFVEKGQNKEILQNVNYIGPLLFTNNDKISVQIDDRTVELEIPYAFASMSSAEDLYSESLEDGNLAEIALGLQDDKVALFIRQFLSRERVYRVELP